MNRKGLFKYPNVRVVGDGHKIVGGKDTGREAIFVGVSKKLRPEELKKGDVIPSSLSGIETDVVEVGDIVALRTTEHRPAPGGVSIGHPEVTAGTLGMIVKRNGVRYILSNNHVLANTNNAQVGDKTWQPGRADGGAAESSIGSLLEFVPIAFSEGSTCGVANFVVSIANFLAQLFGRQTRLRAVIEPVNLVDCAISKPISEDIVSDEILEIGVPNEFDVVGIGDIVKKSGRTTGLTFGTVIAVNAESKVNYGTGTAYFEEQIITSSIAEGGDSGSAVLNESNDVVGLLFAGSDQVTIVNDIFNVIDLLGLDE